MIPAMVADMLVEKHHYQQKYLLGVYIGIITLGQPLQGENYPEENEESKKRERTTVDNGQYVHLQCP